MLRRTFVMLALNACGYTQTFSVARDTIPADSKEFDDALALVNHAAGCSMFERNDKDAVNVYFSEDSKCGKELVSEKADGFTTFTPAPMVCIVSSTTRKASPEDQLNIKLVILHELGHAAGLNHTRDPNDVMFPDTTFYDETTLPRFIQQLKEVGNNCLN